MDPDQQQQQQQQTILLRAIAISSLQLPGYSSSTDRQAAYTILEELKSFAGRIPLCLAWLQEPQHIYCHYYHDQQQQQQQQQQYDITTATKLLALELLDNFLVTGYAKCSETERVTFRAAVLTAARMPSTMSVTAERRILARKLAVVLKGLILRDFPQRWMTLATDLFAATAAAGAPQGLWFCGGGEDTLGMKICLECFKLVAEDCTDSDFNVKISTVRRNDVLQGLNEISNTFLPLFFQLLERSYPTIQQSKATLHSMHCYLLSESRTVDNVSVEEAAAYEKAKRQRQDAGLLLADTLVTLEKFCATLPVTWMLGGGESNNSGAPAAVAQCDFVAAFLHLLRESDAQVQVRAIECLEQLTMRGKLDFSQWMRLLKELPAAFQEANQIFASEQEFRSVEARATNSSDAIQDSLTLQVDFHRALSRLLACVVSSHISHVSSNKDILAGKGAFYEKLTSYLRLLADMLRHPSGRILTEQINMWSTLFRDPQISRSPLLQPFCSGIMTAYMDHMIRIRWEDVENETHPHAQLIEASFDDEEDYDAWMGDFRSRCSLLFRFIGNMEPQIASYVLNSRVQTLLRNHGNGAPLGFLDATNNQLTIKSEAVVQFEAIFQPLDNTLGGIPSWAMIPERGSNNNAKHDFNDRKRAETRSATRSSLTELATALVTWKPSYVWLKFRHASLLDPLKHYWQYDPSTLLQGVDTLIRYLGLPDEWNAGIPNSVTSDEIVGLKKRSGVALVSISKKVPHHLVPWLSQLSDATRSLLSSEGLIPMNQMHLYEFLSCVATAVENPLDRSNFIAEVLSDAVATLESSEIQQSVQSTSSFLTAMGVAQAADRPDLVTDSANVKKVKEFYGKLFTPLNRLLSVGRRCNEAARQRSIVGGVAIENFVPSAGFGEPGQPAFPPDEGPLSLQDLAVTDPFAPIWPRILPTILQIYEVTLSVWRLENQAVLLQDRYQRYVYAISDDEAFLARTQNSKSGGVFGEGGTAGSVVAGTDRREDNLAPRWSGWFNELRNTCFQLIGLLSGQRALYAPEIAALYPRIVTVLTDPLNMKSMEHRHFTQFLKHVVEILLLSCPCSLYKTHLEPIVGPIVEHMRYRLEKTWLPVLSATPTVGSGFSTAATKALCSSECGNVAQIANRGEEEWFSWYYAHAGLFVGDLDQVTSEAAVEKSRVDISRTFSDVLQSVLALKGDWALVLANQAKEEQALKRNDSSILSTGPRNRCQDDGVAVNADGTPKLAHQAVVDARKLLRINGLCHFLLLESEAIAGNITLTVIQCLGYPDAYTCRRTVKICHRILETVAWLPQYTQLLGQQMFTQVVKNVVTEPKWMVGVEWDMINVVRDIYCRLVLGQILQAGGQGPGLQQSDGLSGNRYEQTKTVDKPLQGGGILVIPSNTPRQILASLPGIGETLVQRFEATMKEKRSAKDQKDCIRDLLRIAADNLNEWNPSAAGGDGSAAAGIFDRAVAEESLLHAGSRAPVVQDIPEKLVTQSQIYKAAEKNHQEIPGGLVAFQL